MARSASDPTSSTPKTAGAADPARVCPEHVSGSALSTRGLSDPGSHGQALGAWPGSLWECPIAQGLTGWTVGAQLGPHQACRSGGGLGVWGNENSPRGSAPARSLRGPWPRARKGLRPLVWRMPAGPARAMPPAQGPGGVWGQAGPGRASVTALCWWPVLRPEPPRPHTVGDLELVSQLPT